MCVCICLHVCVPIWGCMYLYMCTCIRAAQYIYAHVCFSVDVPPPGAAHWLQLFALPLPGAGQDGGGQRQQAGSEMATGADVRDILELGGVESENTGTINKKDIINSDKVSQTAPACFLGSDGPTVWCLGWIFEKRWNKTRSCHSMFIFRFLWCT